MLASAQIGARLRLRSRPCSSAGDWLGARDSGFDVTWLRAQACSLGSAWCLGSGLDSVRLGSPARLKTQGSARLRTRRSAWIGARPGSENIISETKPERRKCKTKTFRRESVKVRMRKQTKNANENVTRKKWNKQRLVTSGCALPCFQNEQRQKAAPKGKIYAVATVPTLPVIAWW